MQNYILKRHFNVYYFRKENGVNSSDQSLTLTCSLSCDNNFNKKTLHIQKSETKFSSLNLKLIPSLYTRVHASWIKFYNCPTRCELFSLLHFCRQLYMFRVLTPETCTAAYRNVINWIQSHFVGQLLNLNTRFSFSRAAIQGYIFLFIERHTFNEKKNMQICSCKSMDNPGDEIGTPELQSTNQQA